MFSMTSRLALFRHMIRDEAGNITLFSALILIILLAVSGASVDVMRNEADRVTMQAALDRGVLAAADLDQQQDPKGVVEDYLAKSPAAAMQIDVTVTQSVNSRTVAARGTATTDTIFSHMWGYDRFVIPARATAEEKIANVEISLVLDISGSMQNNNRIERLKPAAAAFVNKVMTEDSNGITTLNLVPFAGQVNPGDTLFDYFRGERPKINQNNGWGNGDQDAPGNSECTNNAENATDCDDSTTAEPVTADPDARDYFRKRSKAVTDMVFYYDTDGDEIYNIAHKVDGFPGSWPRDPDDIFKGYVAAALHFDSRLTDPSQFLGASVRTTDKRTYYYQVKGDENGRRNDIGPTLHKGNNPGWTVRYDWINPDDWVDHYVSPNQAAMDAEAQAEADAAAGGGATSNGVEGTQTVNMPSSCVEIHGEEFSDTAMPKSNDHVPHFVFWGIDDDTMDWGWCPSEEMAIQYYSDSAETLIEFINKMRLHDGTGLQYGMKYGLALLDPVNRPALSELIGEGVVNASFEGRPMDWGDTETEKYIVLMSDGDVTQQMRPNDPENPSNATTPLSRQGSGSWHEFTSAATGRSQFHRQCDLAKQNGVTVFTIAFETSSFASEVLAYCASSASHAFHVVGDEIHDTFDTIARQINNLRLIQ